MQKAFYSIVDLDNNTVNYNEVFWIQSNLALVEKQIKFAVIPQHETSKALSRITQPFAKLKTFEDIPKNKEEQENLKLIIRNSFFLIFVSTLKLYEEVLEKVKGNYKICNELLMEKIKDEYQLFIAQLGRTFIFNHWLSTKSRPTSYLNAYKHLFFDQSIVAKKNRSMTFFFRTVIITLS